MDAITQPSAAADVPATSPTPTRRMYGGHGQPQDAPADYTVLLAADDEWSRETVLRAVVADALQRNGKVVDEETLDARLATMWELVQSQGERLPDADLHPSDAIIPPADLTLEETRALFAGDGSGLIPELPTA